jgi:hypothetical protein
VTLPARIEALVDQLAASRGVVAVALGGSRATGTADDTSDWDLAVYYRAEIDLEPLRAYGEVHPPGSWGRIMNGGAWLRLDGDLEVDVLLRDLDVVDHWSSRAHEGVFEVDGLLAHLAGIPTYTLLAERCTGVILRGELPDAGGFPERLAESAPPRWRFCSQFSLEQARMRERRGDVVGTLGQLARAVIEEAHARACEQRRWVSNEKRIVRDFGLDHVNALFASSWSSGVVDRVERALR